MPIVPKNPHTKYRLNTRNSYHQLSATKKGLIFEYRSAGLTPLRIGASESMLVWGGVSPLDYSLFVNLK